MNLIINQYILHYLLFLSFNQAVMNPLQALFNSMVYRRWTGGPEKVYIPCRKLSGRSALNDPVEDDQLNLPVSTESTPLLDAPAAKSTSGKSSLRMTLSSSTHQRATASINGTM